MSIFEAIVNQFNAHLDATSRSIESLTPYIAEAAHLFVENLVNANKIICCASSNAQSVGKQFCSQLMHNASFDRPYLPALFLDQNNIDGLEELDALNNIYAKQIQAFANEGDVLFLISSSGDEKNLIKALETAITRKMHIVACIGGTQNELTQKIPASEVHIPVSGLSPSQTLCIQFLLTQILAELIEHQLFGSADP